MTKKEKTEKKSVGQTVAPSATDDISRALIRDLNKEMGTRVAYNLGCDDSPTHVKRWISTGSVILDYAISNRRNGGLPEGRVIEIAGKPSIGKSHIALQVAKNVQRMGGLVVYIDTENATPVETLGDMGVDVNRRFVYCDTHCTEEVFQIMDSTIVKAKMILAKDVPILCVWDSIAASSPKAELDGDYDANSIGLNARTISKSMRKIVGVIGQNNVTLLCLNQLRTKIGVMHGDPLTTPGGMAVPYHASVRLRLNGGQHIENSDKAAIGINVEASIIKNKLTAPFRKAAFSIIFGQGIQEHEQILDILRGYCKEKGPITINDKRYLIEGDSTWKTLTVDEAATSKVIVEKKFTKNSFASALVDPLYKPHIDDMLEVALVKKGTRVIVPDDIDPETGEVREVSTVVDDAEVDADE